MDMDYEGAAEIERAWREGLTPDPLLTVSEWSDRHRMLSSKASAEPGRWRTSRTPYLKAIMDCLSPTSPVERVVFMKAAQLGATEMGSNWIGYVIHHAPGPMMAVWPTVEMAKRNSKQRIDPLIEESSALAELIAPARSRDSGNTILAKEFRGGVLVMTGANSAVGLRSMPVRYLFLDEVDGYPLDVEGEGDAMKLAFRLNTGDVIAAGPGNALRFEERDGPRPYLHVRRGLEALVARPVYYELAQIALANGSNPPGVWSNGAFFSLEPQP